MAITAGSTTRAEDIRKQLADEIVRGDLAPGIQLDEKGLATRFGVSRTPIREALRQLEASGLVEQRPHRGSIVANPSAEQLDEMFIAMAELEAACTGLAARNMTSRERKELASLHEHLEELVRGGDPERYSEANLEFHAAIYAGSHNRYLAELTLATRVRLSPFRRAQFRNIGRLALSHGEHSLIVEAIERGASDEAAGQMRAHILTVEEAFEIYSSGLGQLRSA